MAARVVPFPPAAEAVAVISRIMSVPGHAVELATLPSAQGVEVDGRKCETAYLQDGETGESSGGAGPSPDNDNSPASSRVQARFVEDSVIMNPALPPGGSFRIGSDGTTTGRPFIQVAGLPSSRPAPPSRGIPGSRDGIIRVLEGYSTISGGDPSVIYRRRFMHGPADENDNDSFAKVGCLCSCIPPVGVYNFILNREAPEGSRRLALGRFSLLMALLSTCVLGVILGIELARGGSR